MSDPDYDFSGKVPLHRSRFRSRFELLGCELCRAQMSSGSYHSFCIYASEGLTTIRQCPVCGGLWSQKDRGFVATNRADAELELAGVPPLPTELPPVLDVIADAAGDPGPDGRLTLPPTPQGRYFGWNGLQLWQVEALAMVADVLLGQEPGAGTHRFRRMRREESNARYEDYGLVLGVPLDWSLLTSRVDVARHFTVDAGSEGGRFVLAIGSNTAYYSVRGPSEITTSAARPKQ